MAQETITVMVCDRCGKRLELRGDKASAEYSANLREAGRWKSLDLSHMGGTKSWLFCPDDLANFHAFAEGAAVKSA